MAGLVAGTGAYGGGDGAFGLAPGAKILPIRMPHPDEMGAFDGSGYFSKSIRYAADSGAQVINISMSGGYRNPELTEAVRYALDKGSLVFAGVGNDADKVHQMSELAATPGVVAVGAVGKNLRRASWSQYGPEVDISAPGEDMVHACGGKTGLCKTSGTSDATALASASAALIWSKHPTWTNNQVLRVMLNTIGAPTDGAKRNDSIGYGIVRPRIALQNPGDPGPADEYPLPDLAAAASASPSPDQSRSDVSDSRPKEAGTEKTADESNYGTAVRIVLGGLTAAALGGAVAAFVTTRKRRAVRADVPTVTAPYVHGGQPPYPAPQHPPSPYVLPNAPNSDVTPGRGPNSV